jgi:hypothetical protein
MKFLEKDLEEIIYTSGRDVLEEKGLLIEGKLKRQVRIGNYGIADLIEFKRPYYGYNRTQKRDHFEKGSITIYELKLDNISISAFLQALGYAKGIQNYLRKRNKEHLYNINIVIIGRNIDMNSQFVYIQELLTIGMEGYIEFIQYYYGVYGIEFQSKSGSYELKNEGF